jgi:hypothetical protein
MLYRPFGGINATPRDMAAFVQLLLNDGMHEEVRLLSAASVRRMEQPRTSLAARNGLAFGYGLGVYQSYRDGVLFYTHGGDGDGYLSRFGYNRETGLGYFVAINAFRSRALRAMQIEIEQFIARRTTPRPSVAEVDVDPAILRSYTGRYRLAAWRFPDMGEADIAARTMLVTVDRGRLYTRIGAEAPTVLIAVSPTLFRRRDEPDATCGFVRGEDGQLYFEEDESYIKEVPVPDSPASR